MIAHLRGTVVAVLEKSVILSTPGGVGYEVFVAPAVASRLAPAAGAGGEECALFVEHVIREDGEELYGFEALEERSVFRTLISVSKLGPKKALGILSMHAPADLRRIVLEEDVGALTMVSGIGRKIAQQVLLELRYKLDAVGTAQPGAAASMARPGGVLSDAVAGLKNLGYAEEEARLAVKAILDKEPDLDIAAVLRAALKAFAAAKA